MVMGGVGGEVGYTYYIESVEEENKRRNIHTL